MKTLLRLAVAAVLASPAASWAATYQIDKSHTTVGFKIRHMMVSKVHGRFGKFDGTFDYDVKDPKTWKAAVTIEAASIDTGIAARDEHLRSADFFDAAKYPTLEFKSTGATQAKDGTITLKGELTMHGVTKPVTLKVQGGDTVKDPKGRVRIGFSATGKLSRKDFGLTYNQALEAGGVALGDEVELLLEIEGIQQ